jgi:hypothetical protein
MLWCDGNRLIAQVVTWVDLRWMAKLAKSLAAQ